MSKALNAQGRGETVIEPRLVEKLRYLTAIELNVAARAVDLRGGIALGQGAQTRMEKVRMLVPPLDCDRSSSDDLYALSDAVAAGRLPPPQFHP